MTGERNDPPTPDGDGVNDSGETAGGAFAGDDGDGDGATPSGSDATSGSDGSADNGTPNPPTFSAPIEDRTPAWGAAQLAAARNEILRGQRQVDVAGAARLFGHTGPSTPDHDAQRRQRAEQRILARFERFEVEDFEVADAAGPNAEARTAEPADDPDQAGTPDAGLIRPDAAALAAAAASSGLLAADLVDDRSEDPVAGETSIRSDTVISTDTVAEAITGTDTDTGTGTGAAEQPDQKNLATAIEQDGARVGAGIAAEETTATQDLEPDQAPSASHPDPGSTDEDASAVTAETNDGIHTSPDDAPGADTDVDLDSITEAEDASSQLAPPVRTEEPTASPNAFAPDGANPEKPTRTPIEVPEEPVGYEAVEDVPAAAVIATDGVDASIEAEAAPHAGTAPADIAARKAASTATGDAEIAATDSEPGQDDADSKEWLETAGTVSFDDGSEPADSSKLLEHQRQEIAAELASLVTDHREGTPIPDPDPHPEPETAADEQSDREADAAVGADTTGDDPPLSAPASDPSAGGIGVPSDAIVVVESDDDDDPWKKPTASASTADSFDHDVQPDQPSHIGAISESAQAATADDLNSWSQLDEYSSDIPGGAADEDEPAGVVVTEVGASEQPGGDESDSAQTDSGPTSSDDAPGGEIGAVHEAAQSASVGTAVITTTDNAFATQTIEQPDHDIDWVEYGPLPKEDVKPIKGGAAWYRRRIRNYGWLFGLVPMATFGVLAWALQRFSDDRILALLAIASGAVAAPFLTVAGLPFGTPNAYQIAIVASIGIWLFLGWWASRRALAKSMPTWKDYAVQLLWLTIAVGLGIGIAYITAYYYFDLR